MTQPHGPVYIIKCLQNGRSLTLSPTKLMIFSTLLRKVQNRHPRHAILTDLYPIEKFFFRNGSNPTMNKVGGSNCVKVLSTFPCIVYSDVNNCRN